MTAPPRLPAPRRERTARDLRTVAIALCLLGLSGSIWMWMSRSAATRRDKVLAGVPEFPVRGERGAVRPLRPRTPPPPTPTPFPVAEPAPASSKPDAMTSFVLKRSTTVALVHVNALLNTPLFDRLRQCMPAEWAAFSGGAEKMGVDLERDVDRLAVSSDGMAMSGFFEGKPIARNLAQRMPDATERTYRGQSVWTSRGGGIAQVGNLLLAGPADSMDALLDRALDPAPAEADPEDIYGDVFMRTDLSDLRASSEGERTPDAMRALLAGLNGVTVRANVWDTVALSVEGKPQAGRSVNDLAAMARGVISLVRDQVDPEDVELATLAELAKVSSSGEALSVDLALPVNDLFDKLHFPCPGATDGGQQAAAPGFHRR